MTDDGALIEATLEALAGREEALRTSLFERFLTACPEARPLFLTPGTTAIRMTDETLQLLHGIATGAPWVWPQVADLVDLHRAYGRLAEADYAAFIDCTVEALSEEAAAGPEARAAWGRQAEALKRLVAKAAAEWETALPRAAG